MSNGTTIWSPRDTNFGCLFVLEIWHRFQIKCVECIICYACRLYRCKRKWCRAGFAGDAEHGSRHYNNNSPMQRFSAIFVQQETTHYQVMNESAYLFQMLNCYVRFDGIPLCVDVQTRQFVTLSTGCYLCTCELFIWVNYEDCASVSTPFGYRSHDVNVACLK